MFGIQIYVFNELAHEFPREPDENAENKRQLLGE